MRTIRYRKGFGARYRHLRAEKIGNTVLIIVPLAMSEAFGTVWIGKIS